MLLFLLSILLVLLLLIYLIDQKRPKRYPPGPWGLPLIGHLHLFDELPQKTLVKWAAIYGPILSCDFGSFRSVVINDYKMIKEALNMNAFSGRPKLRPSLERSGGKAKGIIFTEGQEWSEQRRFCLRNLRDFGFGKQSQESLINEEVVELIDRLKKESGQPTATTNRFNTAVINALWTMMAGARHSQDDPQLQEIIKMMTELMADPSPAALFMPWLTRLAPEWSGYTLFMSDIPVTRKFLQKFIDEHKTSFVENNPRDFIDVYIDEIFKTKDPKSSFYKEMGEESLKTVLMDLFFASSETTSHTLSWAMLYLSLSENEMWQKKVQTEIDEVVGKSRLPSLTDRQFMPYTEATLMEIMRLSSLIPLDVWHSTIEDVEFNGFFIPKETMILLNLYAVHYDPVNFPSPEEFNPERFLSADKKTIVKPDAYMPFSTGKRVCIGENLAKDELFLFLCGILQIFSIHPDPADPHPSTEPIPGPVCPPRPFKVIFKQR